MHIFIAHFDTFYWRKIRALVITVTTTLRNPLFALQKPFRARSDSSDTKLSKAIFHEPISSQKNKMDRNHYQTRLEKFTGHTTTVIYNWGLLSLLLEMMADFRELYYIRL